MNRETAKKNLQAFGIEEPTDEQVTSYLNQMNGEVKVYKDKANEYKAKADASDDLQAQIDAINESKMSDIEKANKETEKAVAQIADLQKQLANMQLAKSLSDIGITGDDATSVIDSIQKGDFATMTASLGKIISDQKTAAVSAKEQELLKNTPNPGGSKGGADNKTTAERIASNLFGDSNKGGADVLSHYLN